MVRGHPTWNILVAEFLLHLVKAAAWLSGQGRRIVGPKADDPCKALEEDED